MATKEEFFVVARRAPEFLDAAFEDGDGRRQLDDEFPTLTGAVVRLYAFEDHSEAVQFSHVLNGTVYRSEGHARRRGRAMAEGQ